jgi:hypothetical protein
MPTTTTGLATSFIQFTRTSNATVTDSDGRIKWAGHNLLTNSESFDAAAWAKDNTGALNPVVTANYGTAPNGTETADRIVLNKTGGLYSRIMQVVGSTPSTIFTFKVWMKTTGGGTSNVGLRLNGDGVNCVVTGTWTLFSVTSTAASTTQEAQILLFDNIVGNDETADILAWGAQLYRADLGSMVLNPARNDTYYPTTPPNRLGFTEDFSNAAWVKTNILAFGSGSISNAIIAPNGLQTADKIVSSTANNNHRIQWSVGGVLVSGTKYVFSFYAKAAEYTKVQIADAVYSVYNARFDLTGSGSVISSSGCTPAITYVGDGWYRCSAIYTSGGTSAWAHISPFPDSGVTFSVDGASYLGDGISGIYVWGAQLSDSASLTPYSPVYGAAVTSVEYHAPRLDFDGLTLAPKGLLVEELRANLISNGIKMTSVSLTGGTRILDQVVSPDGTQDATIFQGVGGATASTWAQNINAPETKVTMSCYIKVGLASTRTTFVFLMRNSTTGIDFTLGTFSTATGVITGAGWSSVHVGNNWYRISYTNSGSEIITATNVITCYFGAAGGAVYATTDQIAMWGAQVEGGSFVTSLIPTVATATRNPDIATVNPQSFPYGTSEGTVVVRTLLAPKSTGSPGIYSLDDGTTDNAFPSFYSTLVFVSSRVGGSPIFSTSSASLPAGSSVFKQAFAYKNADYAVSFNGGAATTQASGAIPTGINRFQLGAYNTQYINGHIQQVTYIPRRLANAELQARST